MSAGAAADISSAQYLEDEIIGVRHRTQHFYLPLFHDFCRENGLDPAHVRVLDCGCGAGVAIESLADAGFWACGIDVEAARIEQWQGRDRSGNVSFCQADALCLPFANASFDIVFSCGVLEHIGVREGAPSYALAYLSDQAEQRRLFLAECLRVLRQPGILYIDHPNGAFPIDFWHNDSYGRPRLHWPTEKFLPTFREVRLLIRAVDSRCLIEAVSPAGRFTFRRTARRWYGKILKTPLALYFGLLRHYPFSRLTASAFNPYLVLRITRQR